MSYNPLPEDINNNVLTSVAQRDILDNLIVATRSNSIVAAFTSDSGAVSNQVNVTTSGSGSASSGSGVALFETGTGGTAFAQASTSSVISYVPGYEVYVMFTAGFTTPTNAASSQFIGLWDIVNNGVYVGYDGLTFGVALMTGGVQTFIPRSSWNVDLLTGAPTSKFTRLDVPEPINLTLHNLFRIRFGWFGSAPIVFETMNPDGEWIIFHQILQPNTSSLPSIQTPNLPISIQVDKAASDSTNLIISTSCWCAGTASSLYAQTPSFAEQTWTSSTPINAAITSNVSAAGGASLSVIVTGTISTGVISFEATPDGQNWFPLYAPNPTGNPAGTLITYNLALGSATYQVTTGGYLLVRVRLSTAIIGSGSALVEIRPSLTSSSVLAQVFQTVGANLHVFVDNLPPSSSFTGNPPASASVGVTSSTVLAANPLRKGAIFTNTSSNIISFGLDGNPAILDSGITIVPYGSWEMDTFTFTVGAIAAIASGAASNLAIQEMQ